MPTFIPAEAESTNSLSVAKPGGVIHSASSTCLSFRARLWPIWTIMFFETVPVDMRPVMIPLLFTLYSSSIGTRNGFFIALLGASSEFKALKRECLRKPPTGYPPGFVGSYKTWSLSGSPKLIPQRFSSTAIYMLSSWQNFVLQTRASIYYLINP